MSFPSKNVPTKRTLSPGRSKFSRSVATTIYLATILAVLGFLFQSLGCASEIVSGVGIAVCVRSAR